MLFHLLLPSVLFFLGCDGIPAHDFMEYQKDPLRSRTYLIPGTEEIRREIERVEESNKDKVVLYQTRSLLSYFMAWLAHGVMARRDVNRPGDATTNRISTVALGLGFFEEEHEFPSFLQKDSVCEGVSLGKKVRDADLTNAILGEGELDVGFDPTGKKVWKVNYWSGKKTYDSCHDLVYAEAADMIREVVPKLEDDKLRQQNLTTAAEFANYLDEELGSWRDASFPETTVPDWKFATLGIPERLMEVNVNLLGTATSKGWQKDDQMSSWGQLMHSRRHGLTGNAGFSDLRSEFLETLHTGADFRAPLHEIMPEKLRVSEDVRTKLRNLQSLLQCVAYYRLPMESEHTNIFETCWRGTAEPFAPARRLDLDEVASLGTRRKAKQLAANPCQLDPRTFIGYSRVLLQLVLPADIADKLVYISTNWHVDNYQVVKSGRPALREPGQIAKDWSDMAFTRAYSQLKNTDLGDTYTARVLLSRSSLRDVSIVAHSPVFADEALMIFVQLVLNDMRAYLNGEVVVTAGEDWKPVWEVMAAIATGILLLGGFWGLYLRSRHKSPPTREPGPSEVELQHELFRNAC